MKVVARAARLTVMLAGLAVLGLMSVSSLEANLPTLGAFPSDTMDTQILARMTGSAIGTFLPALAGGLVLRGIVRELRRPL